MVLYMAYIVAFALVVKLFRGHIVASYSPPRLKYSQLSTILSYSASLIAKIENVLVLHFIISATFHQV